MSSTASPSGSVPPPPLVEWGVLGSGGAADSFADALVQSETGVLRAVGSRTLSSARAFAAHHGGSASPGSLTDVLADDRVQAVYVGLVNTAHAEWVVRAAEAGKHILCEKPLGIDAAEAQKMVDAAAAAGVILMEGIPFRCHPQTRRLASLVQQEQIGTLLHMEASLGYEASGDPAGRHLARKLGGGAILDVGCYAASMIRMLAGAAHGSAVLEPETVSGVARIGATGVDESAVGVFAFPGGLLATASVSIRMRQPGRLRLYGTEGAITVSDPWRPGSASALIVDRYREGSAQRLPVISQGSALMSEIREFAGAISGGGVAAPGMSGHDCVGNARLLDQWRAAAGC